VAYELRESSYTATNTSMLATAYGRTKEFKDRCAHAAVSCRTQSLCKTLEVSHRRLLCGTARQLCCAVTAPRLGRASSDVPCCAGLISANHAALK
jgi:hypothetical protein